MGSKQYFDMVAREWDNMRSGFFSENVRQKALDVAKAQRGKVAADIGAGTGFMTEGLVSHGLRVIAVDESQEMLDVMRRKFRDVEEVDYRLGEAEHLPIADESVDYVFANMYLHHVDSPQKAIAEMARILKPGGKLVITDLDEHHYEFLRTEQSDRWLGFQRQQIQRWFTGVALKNVSVDCVGENCCAQADCGNACAGVSIFVASGEK